MSEQALESQAPAHEDVQEWLRQEVLQVLAGVTLVLTRHELGVVCEQADDIRFAKEALQDLYRQVRDRLTT